MIRLSVPGTLEYRDVAMRVVSAATKLVLPGRRGTQFDAQVVSAFGEAFNNIAIHGYAETSGEVTPEIEIEIELEPERVLLRIFDHGRSFDPLEVPDPELDDLPERGMGLFIIRSFVDTVVYTPGTPNVLELSKRCVVSEQDSSPPTGPPPKVSVPPGAPPSASALPRASAPPGSSTPASSSAHPPAKGARTEPPKASKSGRAGPSRVRPVRRADSVPSRARAGSAPWCSEPPADEANPLGSRRK